MGSIIEVNDTLQITKEQGFPEELDYEKHKSEPLTAEEFKGKVFEFKNKSGVRVYKAPPVRNFLVENRDGKWLYWGLIHIVEITNDYLNNSTSGKFKIIYLYTPEEMKLVHQVVDRNPKTEFFDNYA